MAQGIERVYQQLEKVFDACDSGKPDHDLVRDRIGGAMAYAQMLRAEVLNGQWKEKAVKATKMLEKKKDNATPKS
jgi:hypothetical protein